MELKDIENYFFGSLVVSQDVAKEVDALLLLALKSEWEKRRGDRREALKMAICGQKLGS